MNRLKEKRMELNLTQPQLSELLKEVDPRIDVGMVSRFEQGVCLPTPAVAKRIEDILQASMSELYGEDDELYSIRKEAEKTAPEWVVAFMTNIPLGKDNAVTRDGLRNLTGMSDRAVRKMIESARGYGYLILNDGDGKGYYQSTNPDEWEKHYHRETARALSVLRTRKCIRQKLKELGRRV